MTNYIIKAETSYVNLSPVGFRIAARDYFKCYLDFKTPRRFSVVPYFLCCRAIELALKAIHLETKKQTEIKLIYSHNLFKAYSDLPKDKQILSQEEVKILKQASQIYSKKDFEYFNVIDVAIGFERYPDLSALAHLAQKFTAYD